MTSKMLSAWLALMAALQFIAGAAALPALMPAIAAQWVQVIVGALGAGTAVYVAREAMMPKDIPDTKPLDVIKVMKGN